MQCHGSLRQPLRDIIKSIGVLAHHPQPRCARGPFLLSHTQFSSSRKFANLSLRTYSEKTAPASSSDKPASSSSNAVSATATTQSSSELPAVPENGFQKDGDAERESILAERERALVEREKVLAQREGFLARQRLADSTKKPQRTGKRTKVDSERLASGVGAAVENVTIRDSPQTDAESKLDTHTGHDEAPWLQNDAQTPPFDPATGQDGMIKPSYLRAYQWVERQKADKSKRKDQIQHERHHQQSGTRAEWLELLDLLTKETPRGSKFHQRNMDTVRLPDGVRAKFKLPTSLALLELMLRTGSHAQMTLEQDENQGFSVLSLWGTAAQNANAIKTLPDLVHLMYQEQTQEVLESSQPISDPSNANSAFEANGSEDGENENAEQLQNLVDDLVGAKSAEHKTAPIRTVWTTTTLADTPAYEIVSQRPLKWSASELNLYVEELTAPVSRSVQRAKQASGSQELKEHCHLVTEELHSLFVQSPEVTPYITERAVNHALGFFIRNNSWAHLRVMFNALEQNDKYQVTASNFNIMLGAAAATGDFFNFQLVIRRMLERNIQPTWRTWTHFYKLASKRSALGPPTKVLRRMRALGVLANTSAYRRAADTAIETEFRTLYHKYKVPLNKIFELYDQRWRVQPNLGSHDGTTRKDRHRHWFTVDGASHMINALLAQAQVHDALEVLNKLERSGEKPNTVLLNNFLSAADRGRHPASAVAALQRLDADQSNTRRLKPDRDTYDILFDVAWNTQCFNMLRVVWRYACSSGNVSAKMHRTILQSLQTYIPTPDSRRKIETIFKTDRSSPQTNFLSRIDWWFGLAGKFAIGVNVGLQKKTEANELSPRERKFFELVSERCEEAAHVKRHVRCKDLLLRDLNEARSITPTLSLRTALEQAWQTDCRWKALGLGTLPQKTELPTTTRKAKSLTTKEQVEAELLALYKQSMQKTLEEGMHIPMEIGDATTSTKA